MKTNIRLATILVLLACAAVWAFAPAGNARAAEVTVNLFAGTGDITVPDPDRTTPIPIWGYGSLGEGQDCTTVPPAGLPGPVLNAAAGDTLVINLTNCLSEPVSLRIPGQAPPTVMGGAPGEFVGEAGAAGGTIQYSFANLRPGSFIYESGSNMARQVQMGLYGALIVGDPLATPAPDREAVILLSEIAPDLHDAVGTGQPFNPVYFHPRYWLINGKAYPETAEIVAKAGQNVLLHVLNAGSQDHTMLTQGLMPVLTAEDGFAPSVVRETYSEVVAPGQTADLVVTPGAAGVYPLYDRALDITNADHFPGGMITMVRVLAADAGGVAIYTEPPAEVSAGQMFTYDVVAIDGGDPDRPFTYELAAGAPAFLSIDADTGRITGDTTGLSGSFSATVNVMDGAVLVATKTFNVGVNANPMIAGASSATVTGGTALAPIALSVTDADGDPLTVTLMDPPMGMALVDAGGGNWELTWTAPVSNGNYALSVEVYATDGKGGMALHPITINVQNAAPVPVGVPGEEDLVTVTMEVRDAVTGNLVPNFKWLITEDNTHRLDPATGTCSAFTDGIMRSGAALNLDGTENLAAPCSSYEQYESNAKPLAAGTADAVEGDYSVGLPPGRYFLSVLTIDPNNPLTGQASIDGRYHKLDGMSFDLGATDKTVTLRVEPDPLPTSRVTTQVFEDVAPLNGAWDRVTEPAPRDGDGNVVHFQVVLEDYLGGRVTQDVYGNPICTLYKKGNPNQDGYVDGVGAPVPGTGGICLTDDNGFISIDHLASNKYEVTVLPPPGTEWVQTTTIEGSKVIDSWAQENNRGNWPAETAAIVFHGFARPCQFGQCGNGNGVGNGTFFGSIRKVEPARAPFLLSDGIGDVVDRPWLALMSQLNGNTLAALVRGNQNGEYTISGVEPGIYSLVVFDDGLDYIMSTYTVIMPPEGGSVPVYDPRYTTASNPIMLIPDWWGQLKGKVCLDENENGVCEDGEEGLSGNVVEVRHRDGSWYADTVTNELGEYHIRQFFPFGHWMIPAIDYGRDAATGARVISAATLDTPVEDRTDMGPVLTMGNFILEGGTNRIDWGKKPYPVGGEGYPGITPIPDGNGGYVDQVFNGGISGVTWYGTTRNAFDIRYAAADNWEPGVPNVEVRLYEALIDPVSGQLVEDADGAAHKGRLLGVVASDHYSANRPENCTTDTDGDGVLDNDPACREVLRTWNQVKPAVFDGGYQFFQNCADYGSATPNALHDPESGQCIPLGPGKYLVEVVPPPNYKLVTANDVNVLSAGDDWAPNDYPMPISPMLAPSGCVGPLYEVTFPDNADFGKMVNGCGLKVATVTNKGNNAAADFHIFTEVPVPGRLKIFVNDNINLEATVGIPQYGDKAGKGGIPVAAFDFRGKELARTHTDPNGFAEMLLPSTQRVDVPAPTGMSPNVVLVYANHPGSPANPDPAFNPNYDTLLMLFELYPGKTNYADMALTPLNGFMANQDIDCSPDAGVPAIGGINNPVWKAGARTPVTLAAAAGSGFGAAQGTVKVGDYTVPAANVTWGDAAITFNLTATLTQIGGVGPKQVLVTTADGAVSPVGITLWTLRGTGADPQVLEVGSAPGLTTIQEAVNAADPGAIVVVPAGIYRENVILHSGISLQGHGWEQSVIDGAFLDPVTNTAWEQTLNDIINSNQAEVDANQPLVATPPTVLVLGGGAHPGVIRVDGVTAQGGRDGGGVHVNTLAHDTVVSNDKVRNNFGLYVGGVSFGFPAGLGANDIQNPHLVHNFISTNGTLGNAGGVGIFNGVVGYEVRSNLVCANGTMTSGGGISHLGTGGGEITDNDIRFNWAFTDGGGILVAGEPPADPTLPSAGTGSVLVAHNRLQGNYATEDGGALSVLQSGTDVVRVENNMMVNNLAAGQGAIRVQDATGLVFVNNTVARNVSTSSSGSLLMDPGPHSAGMVIYQNTNPFQNSLPPGAPPHSDPVMFNNVYWENEAYVWDGGTETLVMTGHSDMALYLLPGESLTRTSRNLYTTQSAPGTALPPGADTDAKVGQDPLLALPYSNILIGVKVRPAGEVAINPIAVPVSIYFEPLGPSATVPEYPGNYHIGDGSAALEYGINSLAGTARPSDDFDGDIRPLNTCADAGADEHFDPNAPACGN